MPDFKGTRARRIRLARGQTRAEVAENNPPLTERLIRSVENGERRPSIATLGLLADALDVPVSFFFSDADERASA